jgi:NADPH-dependent 2,4-dienoyl-CoA reductase/sulfur reductase-like enzyme
MSDAVINCAVAIVGGGTSGLALATELRRLGVASVVVLERESEAGGVPRHCGHYPFGLREFKRLMKGPDYARALVRDALAAGVDIRTDTTVTALHPDARLSLATPDKLLELQAERVILCTGVRESSRAQRFIGGQRPLGVMTTGALQSMVYLHRLRPFRRPVILGTELVSFSAIATCRHLGMRPVAMIEENDRVTVRQIMRPYPALMGVPIRFGARNLQILGDQSVEAVTFTDATGALQTIETDGVIVSGRFRPESALLSASHLLIDPGTGGPEIDQYGRASDPGYYCTGNLLRPVETSSWCWHEAVETAARVARDLAHPRDDTASVTLRANDPAIRFVVPQRIALTDTPGAMEKMQIRLNRPVFGHLDIQSDGKSIWGESLQSRPERRILAPLDPILNIDLRAPVELRILRS